MTDITTTAYCPECRASRDVVLGDHLTYCARCLSPVASDFGRRTLIVDEASTTRLDGEETDEGMRDSVREWFEEWFEMKGNVAARKHTVTTHGRTFEVQLSEAKADELFEEGDNDD